MSDDSECCESVIRLTIFSRMTESAVRATAIEVVVEEVIRRSPEVVAAYTSDPSNAPEWYAKISTVEWKTSPPLGVGARVAFVARFLGRDLRYTSEIVEYGPTSLVMRTVEGPFPMETSYRYAATPEGQTRMTLTNRGVPRGFSVLVRPFLRVAMRRANRKDLNALKQRLEDDQPPR
jgi:hypothetical protein